MLNHGLFSKATGIANGILSRLQKAFNEHSPSKATRKIFKNLMIGSELGLEDEEQNLYNKTDKIASKVLSGFSKEGQIGLDYLANADAKTSSKYNSSLGSAKGSAYVLNLDNKLILDGEVIYSNQKTVGAKKGLQYQFS